MKKLYILLWVFLTPFTINVLAQERTVGLLYYDPDVTNGYTLITSHHTTTTYLINNCGNVVHTWESDFFYGNSVDLLENGLLLRSTKANSEDLLAGGAGGRVELLDWDGNIVWEFDYATETYRHHHDAVYLPNGNILILAWDARSKEEALQSGLNPEYLGNIKEDIWGEHVIEVKPIGQNNYEIVWEWYLWDHLIQDFDVTKDNYGVVEDHPEKVDLNYNVDPGNPDWIHANALAYNAELDQIIVNSRNFSEFWIIDHSTTIEEARGSSGGNTNKGGDILYRYGNPEVYRRGDETNRRLYSQHNTHWLSRDELMIFNNGQGRSEDFSEVFIMKTPINEDGTYFLEEGGIYGPENAYLTYSSQDIDGFVYSPFISSVERLDNGNFLICSGPSGMISEINSGGETLWTYVSPLSSDGIVAQGRDILNTNGISNLMYRARKYPIDYPVFADKDLVAQEEIELNPLVSLCEEQGETVVGLEDSLDDAIILSPNPVINTLNIVKRNNQPILFVSVYDTSGKFIMELEPGQNNVQLSMQNLPSGVYFIKVMDSQGVLVERVIKE